MLIKKSFFYRLFPTPSMKIMISALDKADDYLGYDASFYIIEEQIKKLIYNSPREINKLVKDKDSIEKWIYINIANISGDFAESGSYHIYRGVLNPIGEGTNLLRLFNKSLNRLVEIGVIDEYQAKEEKAGLISNIESIG